MPTYEYACNDCLVEFELFQSFSDDPVEVCDKCGGTVRKIYNNVGVVFKGSGFYKNDSRKAPPETPAPTSKSDVKASTTKESPAPAKD